MNNEISQFLDAGRSFRRSQLHGMVLLIKPDCCLRRMVTEWAKIYKSSLVSCASLSDAHEHLHTYPKCVIIDMDEHSYPDVEKFLKTVDSDNPCAISVVVSSQPFQAERLRLEIPRVTTIIKGEGFESMLLSLLPEMQGVACQ